MSPISENLTETERAAKALALLEGAARQGKLVATAERNIHAWLTTSRYRDCVDIVSEHLAQAKWAELNDVFWKVAPFGTAGRRARMYPIGSNAINVWTVCETAQGLAEYFRRAAPARSGLRVAIAYDTRHRSRAFAELCAEVLAAAGYLVYFWDGYRSTPELSFAVLQLECRCGIMISASHNPPSDNALKVFGPGGGQLRPADVEGLLQAMSEIATIRRRPFAGAVSDRQVVYCQEDMDARYRTAVLAQAFPGPRKLKLLYSPLHGVGLTSVWPALEADGFDAVEVFAPHEAPDGDFSNVPHGIANPEDPAVFIALIEHAQLSGADLALASDPDADRIGCAAPLARNGSWQALTGNQIAVLLAEYILRGKQAAGTLTKDHYLVKTLVTTDMLRRLADYYGIRTIGNVLTGFRWISAVVDQFGPERCILACEEAHGYMIGHYARDKDAAAAAILLAEAAAEAKTHSRTLHEELTRLYGMVGYHEERTRSLALPGADGMAMMRAMMEHLRSWAPNSLAGLRVMQMRDYLHGPRQSGDDPLGTLAVPPADLVMLDLEADGNYVAVRPSGTEPKLKVYLFAYRPPAPSVTLEQIRSDVDRQLLEMESDLLAAMSL